MSIIDLIAVLFSPFFYSPHAYPATLNIWLQTWSVSSTNHLWLTKYSRISRNQTYRAISSGESYSLICHRMAALYRRTSTTRSDCLRLRETPGLSRCTWIRLKGTRVGRRASCFPHSRRWDRGRTRHRLAGVQVTVLM